MMSSLRLLWRPGLSDHESILGKCSRRDDDPPITYRSGSGRGIPRPCWCCITAWAARKALGLFHRFKTEAAPTGAACIPCSVRRLVDVALPEQGIEPRHLVAVHGDLLAILGFHHLAFFHACGAAELVLHSHLSVLEGVERRTVLELNR